MRPDRVIGQVQNRREIVHGAMIDPKESENAASRAPQDSLSPFQTLHQDFADATIVNIVLDFLLPIFSLSFVVIDRALNPAVAQPEGGPK
jgi:hypothetical protein